MEILTYLYLFLLLTTTAKSILQLKINSLKAQDYMAVYLIATCSVEFFAWLNKVLFENYNNGIYFNIYLTLCILFFTLFYSRKLDTSLARFLMAGGFLSLIYIFIFSDLTSEKFEIKIGMTVSIFYIFCSLIWFYFKINSKKIGKITDDPLFWVSTALLLWSCFFIFRVMPMFLFESIDKDFLSFMKSLLFIVNILTYSLIYIALFKYKRANIIMKSNG